MADIGAQPAGAGVKAEGSTFVPLRPMVARLDGTQLDLSDVRTMGTPETEWLMSRNEAEGMIPGRPLRHSGNIYIAGSTTSPDFPAPPVPGSTMFVPNSISILSCFTQPSCRAPQAP